jgi:hypothetical protein
LPDALAQDASDATDAGEAHDAGDATDAAAESSVTDGGEVGDAGDASDAGADSPGMDGARPPPRCNDECAIGNQECTRLPQVCTYDDAGFTVGCQPQGPGVSTCVVGDAGCTVWSPGGACRSDVSCCVTCVPGDCPLGSVGDPCQQDTDCGSNACDAVVHACVSYQCADHRQDGLEADVDCGGRCKSCGGGQRCNSNGDCEPGHVCYPSHVCSGPTLDASASDAAADATPCVDECTLGDQACSVLPQVCTYDDAGFTAACEAPGEGRWTCVTGSSGCALWAPGVACGAGVACCAACSQVPCDAGAGSLCWTCPPGAAGKPCEQDTDCVSAACDAATHACITDPCADHRQDGLETDVDCGGPSCGPCQEGGACQGNRDCQPGHVCASNGYQKVCT